VYRGQDRFDQYAQGRDIPLAFTERVNESPFRLLGLKPEVAVERQIGPMHAQVGHQNYKRLLDGINDVFRMFLGVDYVLEAAFPAQ